MLSIDVEITNKCNTHCFHCPREKMCRDKGSMSLMHFKQIFNQIDNFEAIRSVDFSGMGEPLLHPEIEQFVSHFSKKTATSITTNASLLNNDLAYRLADA
jgi:MoaA/NifB/PqqE/SkfB family radical SAM enzyme